MGKEGSSNATNSDGGCQSLAASVLPQTAPPTACSSASRTSGNKSRRSGFLPPPLGSYWFSPFSSCQMWAFRIQLVLTYLYGGLVGWPMIATAALLPQLLLRLFTLGGCGLLLVYDCLFGLRWVYTRLLLLQQRKWVQHQLDVLLQVNMQETTETLANERLRLQQLVIAMRRSLSASHASVSSAAVGMDDAEPLAAEADAAAQVAVGGDLRMAAALYGVSREAVRAALSAARLQHLRAQSNSRKGRDTMRAAAAAIAAAAGSWLWWATKRLGNFAWCVLLLTIFTDLPATRAAAAADAGEWFDGLHPWLLPLIHAAARGCLAAAVMNLHVGKYTELALFPPVRCGISTNTLNNTNSSNKITNNTNSKHGRATGCVLENTPRMWHMQFRLFIAFLLPIGVSTAAAVVSTAAAAGSAWQLWDFLQLPLGLTQFLLQLLPPEVSVMLPLHDERSAAADRLLQLLQQQETLGWLQWPQGEAASDVLLPAALVTTAAALLSQCSSPPFLWQEHARLEHAAAQAAAKKLLGKRSLQLKKQNVCSRISSKFRWGWEALLLRIRSVPNGITSLIRMTCVFIMGFLWVLVLLAAVSDLPLLRTDEGDPQTPMQFLREQLQQPEVQQYWRELKHLKRELQRRSREDGLEEAFEWFVELLQDTWKEQLEAERNENEAYEKALELFGLSGSASAADIRQRYRQLAKQYHPDLVGNVSGAQGLTSGSTACGEGEDLETSDACRASHESMQRINLAYEILLGQAGGKGAGLNHRAG